MMRALGAGRSRQGTWRPPVWELVVVFVVGAVLIGVLEGEWPRGHALAEPMRDAAETMRTAMDVLAAHRIEHGPPLDSSTDINETGLIGAFFSELTTTVGSLEAKRTTTNPNVAALLVSLLCEAGAQPGDFVAVGASGSFPALVLATVSAGQALGVRVGLIISLGSSQFGANLPDFTWIEMERILAAAGVVSKRTVAASLGGDLDVGRDLEEDVRRLLRDKIDAFGVVFLDEPDLARNVEQRMSIYEEEARDARIAAFVSVGGGWANLGSDASVLSVPPGLTDVGSLPPPSTRGVLHAMADRGVPVIHLLNMKDLIRDHGLPWDPSPLPGVTEWAPRGEGESALVLWCGGAYVGLIAGWFTSIVLRRRSAAQRRRPS